MIHSIKQELTLSIPLSLASHSQAQVFYQQHADSGKAKQVYLNTLALEAVRTYLSWLGITTDLQAGSSWDPIIQALSDVADLELPSQGKLECRPVLPGAETCYILPETNGNRIGYLPVLLDSALETATLLGFIPSASVSIETEEIPLSQLQPITALLDLLAPCPSQVDEPTYLGQWLKGTIASSWQVVETLLDPQPIFSFRNLEPVNPATAAGAVARVKMLVLEPPTQDHYSELLQPELLPNGKPFDDHLLSNARPLSQSDSYQVALVVGIAQSDALQSDVWVRLCPFGGDRHLPDAMEIRLLDDRDVVVMEAQSRQTDMLQLNFRGMLNEQFTVEVALNDISLIERFVI